MSQIAVCDLILETQNKFEGSQILSKVNSQTTNNLLLIKLLNFFFNVNFYFINAGYRFYTKYNLSLICEIYKN